MNTGEETIQKINSSGVVIGYMMNPDKVFYSEMDDVIIKYLESAGAKVERCQLEDIHFAIGTGRIEVHVNERRVSWDGFLSYGYMSKFHFEAYMYIISSMDAAGIACLHNAELEKILNNKYLQGLQYAKAGVPIPDTHIGFSINAFKHIANENYSDKSIVKKLDDYGGDGVAKSDTKEHLVNFAAKNLWKNEYCLFQKFVPDVQGKSVRVLCIDGKAVAIAQYEDKTNSFKSNNSFGYEFFSLNSLMDSENYEKYASIGEKAIKSLGNLVIGGVDILDSTVLGCVVLEVNGWPDIYDIAQSTKQNIFEQFAASFINKCTRFKESRNKI